MNCPVCGKNTFVWDVANGEEEIFRKRKCKFCGGCFCTIEYEVDFDENFRKEWSKYRGWKARCRKIKQEGKL